MTVSLLYVYIGMLGVITVEYKGHFITDNGIAMVYDGYGILVCGIIL